MNKDEIFEASRRENKNKVLAELEVSCHAGNIAGRVGTSVCCLILLLVAWITKTVLFSPWIIYFSILGTYNLVRYTKLKKKPIERGTGRGKSFSDTACRTCWRIEKHDQLHRNRAIQSYGKIGVDPL